VLHKPVIATYTLLALAGCSTTIRARGTYDEVWTTVASGLTEAGFHEHKEDAKWATGFEYERGAMVARRYNSKFSSDLVDVTIAPVDQSGEHVFDVRIYGWKFDWTNLFLLKSWRPAAQGAAADSIEKVIAASDVLTLVRK
jgi:hypothetical protein